MERFDLSPAEMTSLFFESIPEAVRQRIVQAVDETTRQPYWFAIQNGVQADLGEIIKSSIADGDSPGTMARRIREQLGGDDARRRAQMIARTETTGSLNCGHNAALESTAESGEVLGKEWLCVGDDSTRNSHLNAHGQIVTVKDNFSVGGFECPYPGWHGLPAQERVRCRYTTVAAFDV